MTTQTAQHTPTPWRVEGTFGVTSNKQHRIIAGQHADEWLVAVVEGCDPITDDEDEANAALALAEGKEAR